MSTISTDDLDKQYENAKERLREIQARITQAGSNIQELVTEINIIRAQKPFTQSEFYQQQNAIDFKERQINETQKIINVLGTKAAYIARMLGITL